MDSGYVTKEERAANPYQSEADAHLPERLPHFASDRLFKEQDVDSHSLRAAHDPSQGKTIQTFPRRFHGPCTRNLNHSSATNVEMEVLDSAQTRLDCSFGTSFADSVHERSGSTLSGSGCDGRWSSRLCCDTSSTQDDTSLLVSFDGSAVQSAIQSSSEALISEHQLVKSRKLACEHHLAAFRSNMCDASSYDASYDWRFEPSTMELGAGTVHESYFCRSDSAFLQNHEFKQYSDPRVHNGQDMTSFFDSPAGCPSQHQKSTFPEFPRQIQPYEPGFLSSPGTDNETWTKATARDSQTHVDIRKDVQWRQQHAVSANEIGAANAEAKRSVCAFSRDRFRQVLLQGLMQDSDCIEDCIKGWNDETACIVTLGIMENFARQGNVHLAEKCAELMLSFGPSPIVARTFNVMISACMKDGNVSAALRWWSRFTSMGMKPTQVTYNSMINVCARGSDLGQAEWWMERMLSDGIQPCLKSFTTLIVACGQSGSEHKAEYWFQRMQAYGLRGDTILYNAMIDAYVKVGNVAQAEMWFRKMQAEGVVPVQRTFNLLLHACVKNGNIHGAEQWRIMMQEAGLRCDEYTYGSLIDGCARCHDMSLAEHFLRRMFSEKLKPNLVILRSLSRVYGLKDGDRLAIVLGLCIREGGASPDDVWKALKSRGAARFKSQALEELLADISRMNKHVDTQPGRHPRGQGDEADGF
eukprot:TRINITY_DN7419_c0_g1_i3.p1 TRINITY_DN7419_c0_g1~~TRINITY_DN7419_c0_g1_i3.p1  ORF type:complete len:697 (+),score=73.49 TRINITY_DN7419_c0_g1_i3:118-2208(+)